MALRHEDLTTYVAGLPAGSLEDRELAIAFKQGEDGAYQAIYDRYSQRVHGVCRRMLGQPDDAAEAAQETFLRIYQALPRFNGRYQLGAWITRIATNVCLDHLRSRSRKPVDPVPQELLELDAAMDETSDPEFLHIRNTDSRRVRRVLAKLPPMHRAAIVLRDFEGLSYDEVAVALGITDCQVKALIHRARQGFKRSWIASTASMFLPARLLERFRSFEATSRDQIGHALSSGSNMAVSCNIAMQHCGQIMADKVGSLAVAAGMTFAAVAPVAAAAAAIPGPVPSPEVVAVPAVEDSEVEEVMVKTKRVTARPVKVSEASAPAPAGPKASPPAPAPSETPTAPAPTPKPTPVEGGGSVTPTPAPSPTASATPQPEPEPDRSYSFATGFVPATPMCAECGYQQQVVSERGYAGEDHRLGFSQTVLDTMTSDGTGAYGIRYEHSSDGSGHTTSFRLRTAEGSYYYAGTGGLVSSEETSWGGRSYTYTGNYQLGSRPTQDEPMPESGTYTVTVEFSSKQSRILNVSFFLGH